MATKYMDIKEFVVEGYLQEVNRQFFHPLGLALVIYEDDDGTAKLKGVWDCRDEVAGVCFGDGVLDSGKAKNIDMAKQERVQDREKELGYWIQPVEK